MLTNAILFMSIALGLAADSADSGVDTGVDTGAVIDAVPDIVPEVASGAIDLGLPLHIDASDPAVALLVWLFSAALHSVVGDKFPAYKHLVPTIAILLAVSFRAAYAGWHDGGMGLPMLLRSVAAGAVAVLAHSQFREVEKAFSGKLSKDGKKLAK